MQSKHHFIPHVFMTMSGKINAILKLTNPPVNYKDETGAMPMHIFVYENEIVQVSMIINVVKQAVRKGFEVNSQTDAGETLLHIVTQSTHTENLLRELLNLDGVDVTLGDELGDNFLHSFLRHRERIERSEELIFYLLDGKSSVSNVSLIKMLNQKNKAGYLPISLYIIKGIVNVQLVLKILEYIQDVNTTDNLGNSLLQITVHSPLLTVQKLKVIKTLIGKAARTDLKDIFGRTPIFYANDLRIVRALVEGGACVNATDQCKRTPLMATLKACNARICQYLINKGARINRRDKFGHNALHYAAWENRLGELDVLLRNGADSLARDRSGRTARDLAIYWRCIDGVNVIDKHADPKARHPSRKTQGQNNAFSDTRTNLWIHMKKKAISIGQINEIANLKKHFDIPENTEEYIEQVIEFPGVGIPKTVNESSFVESLVLSVAQAIACYIGQKNYRFKCSVVRSGSTKEGTKIGDPDEFDFLFVLDKFSELCEVSSIADSHLHSQGFERVVLKDRTVKGDFIRYFIPDDMAVLCGRIRDDFFVLAKHALTDKSTWLLDEVFIDEVSISNDMNKPIVNFSLFIIGALYKGISVSVDIVPAIRVKKWKPEDARLDNKIIPKEVLQHDFLLLCQLPLSETHTKESIDAYFRVSCAPLEIALMHGFPAWIRQGYALSKMMKSNFMCPEIKFKLEEEDNIDDDEMIDNTYASPTTASDEITSYMLKNSLFQVVASEPDILRQLPFPGESELYNSTALALRMFDYLGQSAEKEMLSVFLLPYLNIFTRDEEQNTTALDDDCLDKVNIGKQCRKIKTFCDFIQRLNTL